MGLFCRSSPMRLIEDGNGGTTSYVETIQDTGNATLAALSFSRTNLMLQESMDWLCSRAQARMRKVKTVLCEAARKPKLECQQIPRPP